MIGTLIQWVLTHLPLLLTAAALACAALTHGFAGPAERVLSWLLLLAVGAESLWAGIFHVFLPGTAAAFIGWQVSPFQFEIGVADLSIGLVAVLSFWRGLEFKAAVVAYAALFYFGVAIGHLHQMTTTGNTSPGNFGLLLALTVIKVVFLPLLRARARRDRSAAGTAPLRDLAA